MVSDIIRNQVEEIKEQNYKQLQELSILVLLIAVPYFVDFWFSAIWTWIPYKLDLPNALWIAIGYDIAIFMFTLAFLTLIASYLWRFRSKPQFLVLFIERIGEQRQIVTKHFLTLVLIPTSISVGLASSEIMFSGLTRLIFPVFYKLPFWLPFRNSFGTFSFSTKTGSVIGGAPVFPFIIVVCLVVLLSFVYHIKPERVRRSIPWLLFIPIIVSMSMLFYSVAWNLLNLHASNEFVWTSGGISPLGGAALADDIMFFSQNALFLASFIALFYLTYLHLDAERKKFYTLAREKHLRGFIKEGVGILPKRVRVGNSYNIPIDLALSKDFMSIYHRCKFGDYLEVELQGVELKIGGEKRLRICETSPLLITGWNCSFPTPGTHAMNLKISVVKRDNSRHLIFTHAHDVKVNSLLSISWVPVFTLITPILTSVVHSVLQLR